MSDTHTPSLVVSFKGNPWGISTTLGNSLLSTSKFVGAVLFLKDGVLSELAEPRPNFLFATKMDFPQGESPGARAMSIGQ